MPTDQEQLVFNLTRLIMEKWISKPIYAVSKLRIADILSDGPKTIEEIANISNSHSKNLYRVMRALASVGIFSELENKRFALTPLGELLKTGKEGSVFSSLFHAEWNDKAWAYLLESIKTGKTAFDLAYKAPLFEWIESNPEASSILNEANSMRTKKLCGQIVKLYDFSIASEIIDIGGGIGTLLIEILNKNPLAKGTLVELPNVASYAEKEIKGMDVKKRYRVLGYDFFDKVPSGADIYILSNILHDWPDKNCKIILNNCYKAMSSNSKLLVIEMIIPTGNKQSVSKLLDLEMMVITGGLERTKEEFYGLFESSDFKISNIISLDEDTSIMELIKV